MSLRESLRKAAGLLVELPPEEAGSTPAVNEADLDKRLAAVNKSLNDLEAPTRPHRTVEQIVQAAPGVNLDQVKIPVEAVEQTRVSSDGSVDFAAVYKHANLPVAPFTAEQMLEMFASLPSTLPIEMKRQTVKVTVDSMGKAIGATPDTIVADASRKLAALTEYSEAVTKQAAQLTEKANAEITALTQQIEDHRKTIESAKQREQTVAAACKAEADRLDDVLEFFSLDIPPSKYAGS